MRLSSHHSSLMALDTMPPDEMHGVLASARTLQRAAQSGTVQPLLRGKNLALLCETMDGEAMLFHRAAVELGAQVAHLRPSFLALGTPEEVRHTARMLGRLYDAVQCHGVALTLAQQIGQGTGVPVSDHIVSPQDAAALVHLLGDAAMPADHRHFVIQAMLLGTIS